MAKSDITDYLAENPRKMGVLFTMMLLLTQAGNVSAGAAVACYGP